MKTYRVSIAMEVEVNAFTEADAISAVEDVFGLGDTCGLQVTEFQVLDHEPVE